MSTVLCNIILNIYQAWSFLPLRLYDETDPESPLTTSTAAPSMIFTLIKSHNSAGSKAVLIVILRDVLPRATPTA
ncbi:unnamed protein product [Zymoseptoria tritici ST99CH_3D7]|uniref:Uncharacterized protein n=1 Tax=Zymoseptoria tritici (strain ST99CH_3D7) TaxID=1276538 RepID=A0A1X7RFQ1_ZYMT9|nr:unnamed protein product [Zymoseptoria tritici ST99CH_3D7]